jgi:hypothetical protein
LCAACTQTDIVAREQAASVGDGDGDGDASDGDASGGDAGGGDAGGGDAGDMDASCEAKVCARFASGQSRCEADAPSGALLQVGDGCEGQEPRFVQALCSCTDFVSESALIVEHADPGGARASVAIDGMLTSSAEIRVQGALRVAGAYETQPSQVTADSVRLGELPACACAPDALPNLAEWIDLADPDLNRAGFDAGLLENVTSDEPQVLPCGNLVVDRIGGSSDLRLRVQGKLTLLVRGDLSLDGGMQVLLDDGAELDLIVAGNVRVVSAFELGSEASAGRVRMYVGGDGTIDLGAESFIAGLLYAPRAELVTRGPFELRGPLFVRRAAPNDSLRIRLPASGTQSVECAQ